VTVEVAEEAEEVEEVEKLSPTRAYIFNALEPPQYSLEFPAQVIVQAELPLTDPGWIVLPQ
jgi:hypothetical protein